jgi:hypothetical protein
MSCQLVVDLLWEERRRMAFCQNFGIATERLMPTAERPAKNFGRDWTHAGALLGHDDDVFQVPYYYYVTHGVFFVETDKGFVSS